MTGRSWPQAIMGALILLMGLAAMRHGLSGAEVRWHGYWGGGPGSPLPLGPEVIVLLGAGIAAFGIHVLVQAFR